MNRQGISKKNIVTVSFPCQSNSFRSVRQQAFENGIQACFLVCLEKFYGHGYSEEYTCPIEKIISIFSDVIQMLGLSIKGTFNICVFNFKNVFNFKGLKTITG